MSARAAISGAVLVAGLAAFDQVVKAWVETHMTYQEFINIVPFFALYRTHNTGIAFSMLKGFGPWPLIVITIAVCAFVTYLWSRTPVQDVLARLGFGLILGGALGNLIDRVQWGYVVDYFLFHTPVWSFAVFNLADALITLGAGLVILQEVKRWRSGRTQE
jgi:signal peptidase II